MSWIILPILLSVVIMILWRPWNLNEAIPAVLGAILVFELGFVTPSDIGVVFHIVSGAGLTIVATMFMSAIMDSVGFFLWAAIKMAVFANGSGKKLFFFTLMLSFLMTLFFNNDGSILITTPIIIEITNRLRLNKREALPYLLGGALVASASSAPIGVSNLANLIALKIVGLNLIQYGQLMILPSILGILVCTGMLYLIFRNKIPSKYNTDFLRSSIFEPPIPLHPVHPRPGGKPKFPPPEPPHRGPERKHHLLHQSHNPPGVLRREANGPPPRQHVDRPMFIVGTAIIILVRIAFFVGARFGVSTEYVSISGALILLAIFGLRHPARVKLVVTRAPWYILVFAFGMYTIVYSLRTQGFTGIFGHIVNVHGDLLWVIVITGLLLTLMSCLMNNLSAVMLGTLVLTSLHLSPEYLKLSYLAGILGSDIGALLLPIGTLASLMWLHIVKQQFQVGWIDYLKASIPVIVPSLVVSLLTLYFWGNLLLPSRA